MFCGEHGFGSAHLSASPITGSMLPMTATTSEIIPPRIMTGRDWRLENDGERILDRQGYPSPLLTRYQPSSPFEASMAWYVSPTGGLMPKLTIMKSWISSSILL